MFLRLNFIYVKNESTNVPNNLNKKKKTNAHNIFIITWKYLQNHYCHWIEDTRWIFGDKKLDRITF